MSARRWSAPAGAVVAVTLIVTFAVWLSDGSRAQQAVPLLQLRSAGADAPSMAAAATATSERVPAARTDQPYTLVGTLPHGRPPAAPVYRVPDATAAAATAIARALHLAGVPTRAHGGWVLRAGDRRLAVRDDGSWSLGMDCFSGPAAQEELTVGCAYASAPGTRCPPGADPATARAVLRHLMTALGGDVADIEVNPGAPTTYAAATPRVGGQPAFGWTTGVAVAADGSIDHGDGWIGTPTRGPSYPLITAQRAFELLQQRPRPMTDVCMLRKDGQPGCADLQRSTITGASLGLAMDYDNETPVLVPAWLFRVQGQHSPVAQVAVDPKYIA